MKILLADHVTIVRQALGNLLTQEQEMEVVGEAVNPLDTIHQVEQLLPDVVVLAADMPPMGHLHQTTRQIIARAPSCRVVVLSSDAEPILAQQLLEAGASGFVLKRHNFDELRRALEMVADDGVFLSQEVNQDVEEPEHEVAEATLLRKSVSPKLSGRERQVLGLLAEGQTSKAIASMLQLSLKTVESHRLHITKKLGIRSVAALTKYAIRQGLTSLDK